MGMGLKNCHKKPLCRGKGRTTLHLQINWIAVKLEQKLKEIKFFINNLYFKQL
jgi:hypothetical protein